MDSRLVVRRHQPVSCIFRGSCGGGGVLREDHGWSRQVGLANS